MNGVGDAAHTYRAPDGAAIAYRLWRPGPGRPLVALLHGVASNLTRWSEFVATTTLRERWDLLRVDLRGNGGSVHRGRLGMAEWCADLAGIMGAEGYRRAVVAGHCLGANIALEFAARHPGRAAGLVLVEPLPAQALRGAPRRLARVRGGLRPVVALLRALRALGLHRRRLATLDLAALDRQTRAALAGGAQSEALLARYASPLADLRETPTVAYLQMLLALAEPLPPLGGLSLPVLALLATGSTFADPARTEAVLAALPEVEIVRLPARHWIPTEQPEAMRHAIEAWCERLLNGGDLGAGGP